MDAGSHVVQHWSAWEARANQVFSTAGGGPNVMHGVMGVVCCLCFGDTAEVKGCLRDATPDALAMCSNLLGHLQQFAVIVEAETRFRAGELSSDWTLQSVDGKMVVRSEFRVPEEMEH
jgi:hypothetical protein